MEKSNQVQQDKGKYASEVKPSLEQTQQAPSKPVLSSKGRDWKAAVAFTASQTDEYYSLKADHPNIFKYLENCFRRYAWTKACILAAPHLSEGTPWSQTRKSNPYRWGVRIEEEFIREWFLPRV